MNNMMYKEKLHRLCVACLPLNGVLKRAIHAGAPTNSSFYEVLYILVR